MGLKRACLIVDVLDSTNKFILKEGLPSEDPDEWLQKDASV